MLLSAIRDRARKLLNETTPNFWSDAELDEHVVAGVKVLWREINNLNQDFFFASATVTQAANATQLSSMPVSGVSRILGLKPLVQASYPSLNYFPRRYTSPDFTGARSQDAQDPTNVGKAFYALAGAGAPASAGPTIYVAPKFTSDVSLELIYVPTLGTPAASSENPLPGELDDALVAWTVAHALAKEAESSEPDPVWLSKFKTEKDSALIFLDPRQDDEPKVAEEMFGELWE
jgi:hypothetical protein